MAARTEKRERFERYFRDRMDRIRCCLVYMEEENQKCYDDLRDASWHHQRDENAVT